MRAIAAHFDYITRKGTLEVEDDRGVRSVGKEAVRDLVDQWRYAGSLIESVSHRREALNVTLSMPQGTPPVLVMQAVRQFARQELPDNRYVMVLHTQQAHPHVHLTVRAQSKSGSRLNVWADRHRWRESFADKLRGLGVDAQATSQVLRGENRRSEPLWRASENIQITVEKARPKTKSGERYYGNRAEAMKAWAHIMKALAGSPIATDRELAERVARYIRRTPFAVEIMGPSRERPAPAQHSRVVPSFQPGHSRERADWEMTR
ncbi:relaxase/mobilization nuclease domain-containing protein [Roseateles sp. NT4]|uniref:relaxase/mobilization nuclease domain-containing protein n=1 Tax=Roseateles sp. NT4 TaxID=3453715 RepID=UPI003EED437B